MAKIEVSKTELAEIFSNYKLGELQDARPLSGGTVQTNLLVETTAGKFVLRLYDNRSPESVRFEANLIGYLRVRHYPCPALFRNKHGRFTGLYDGRPYALFEFVEGYHIERPTSAQKEQLIERVAQLHNLTRNYHPALIMNRWNYSPALCRELAGKAAAKSGHAGQLGEAKMAGNNPDRVAVASLFAERDLPRRLPFLKCAFQKWPVCRAA